MRMTAHKATVLSITIIAALSLSGCYALQLKSVSATAKCSGAIGGKINCEGGVTGTWEPKPGGQQLVDLLALADVVPDAAQFSFDTTGSTFAFPSTGSVNVVLTDTSTGVIQGSAVFPWVRTGNIIKLQSPDAVNTWVIGHAGTADRIDYKLVRFSTTADPGLQQISIAAKNEGEPLASATDTFQGPCTRYPSPYQCREF